MELGKRLSAVLGLLPSLKTIADIGTDHAYLPVKAVEMGKAQYAIASDNKEGPCEAARKTIAQHQLTDKIQVRQGDGLLSLAPGEVEGIVLAGMGGLTMVSILTQGLAVLQAPNLKALVLQPQSDGASVRQWAENAGFAIYGEELAQEGDKLYEMFVLRPQDGYVYPGKTYEVGDLLITQKHPLLKLRLEKLLASCLVALEGKRRSKQSLNSKEYVELENKYKVLKEIYHENYSC